MEQDSERQQRAKAILEALDRTLDHQEEVEQRDDELKAVRYESTLTRLKDVQSPAPD